jgi:hypothetical protein
MLTNEFYKWLVSKGYNEKVANARKSNCLRVCEYEGDLDIHFETDSCNSIIEKLSYSTEDERDKSSPKHKIPIDGNIRKGTATLKQAVRLYVDFMKSKKDGILSENQPDEKKVRTISKTKNQSNWPKWELPTDEEIYLLAKITTRYIRFLNPDIIKAITDNNVEHFEKWRKLLSSHKINSDLYLWEKSPCCFPGIRRYAGSKENAHFRKQTEINESEIENALKLDDNDFPKQIWSFILRGKQFGKFGPDAYSLAHLFDHKESKNRMKDELEFINGNDYSAPFFGLYTCPSNTVYIPNSLLKPTDFNISLRKLLFKKAESLYKDCCNILPPFVEIPNFENKEWNIENFQWGECVGTMDNINMFLNYRNSYMEKITKK